MAAARKVSAAPRMTVAPSLLKACAIFAIVVVLPAPLTPTTSMISGFGRRFASQAAGLGAALRGSRSARRAGSRGPRPSA